MSTITIEETSTEFEDVAEKLQRVRGQAWGGYAELPVRVPKQPIPKSVKILNPTQHTAAQNVSVRSVDKAGLVAKTILLALAESSEVSMSSVVRNSLESLQRTASAFATISDSKKELVRGRLLAFTSGPEGESFSGILRLLRRSNDADWTDEKNDRRCELIDKDIEGTIRPFERRELAVLQQQMLAFRRKNAPLPLKEAQALHQELLKKAGELEK